MCMQKIRGSELPKGNDYERNQVFGFASVSGLKSQTYPCPPSNMDVDGTKQLLEI
jgi:hypothetical protein